MPRFHLIVGAGSGIGRILVDKILFDSADKIIAVDKNFEPNGGLDHQRVRVFKVDICDGANWKDIFGRDVELSSCSFLAPSCKSRDSKMNECGFTDNFVENIGRVNYGFLHIIRAAMPRLSDNSHMVFVSSVLGTRVAPEASLDYHASKSTLESIAKYMAVKLAPRVHVNVLAPGLIARNDSSALITDPLLARMVHYATPLERAYSQEEIAVAVRALGSGQMGRISGQTIYMDGGASIQESFSLISRAIT